ncbi:hypothetical protein Ga0123462_1496 [Mariprofundus ferrinatatus]|uniref:Uncharacterized protein n=1 Tax=Mariprofundus ferrinatatus TaxID=1921087 RepID=A0A2K8L7Y1_9PROT|nr:hypothetical protein Ga0123462_1496 [Mariprofundus ferrinatatus]
MLDMDVTKLDIPIHFHSDPNCLYKVDGICCHGANPVRRHECRTYCPVTSVRWVDDHFGHLSNNEKENMIRAIANF